MVYYVMTRYILQICVNPTKKKTQLEKMDDLAFQPKMTHHRCST